MGKTNLIGGMDRQKTIDSLKDLDDSDMPDEANKKYSYQ